METISLQYLPIYIFSRALFKAYDTLIYVKLYCPQMYHNISTTLQKQYNKIFNFFYKNT